MTSTNLYSNNLDILVKRFGIDYEHSLQEVNSASRVEVVMGKRGLPTFYYREDDGRKVLFHSLYNPQKEAYLLIQQKNLVDVPLVFILGIGFAYHIEQLRKDYKFYGNIFIIEPSFEILKAAMENKDLSSMLTDPKVQVLVEPDANKLKDIIYNNSLFNYVCSCEIIYLPTYQKVFAEYFAKALDAIAIKVTRRICDFVAINELAGNWESNSLANLPEIFKSVPVASFYDNFKGTPAIIVAAGPSLDKNIEQLKPLTKKAVVISVGTSLRPLLKKGIKPHFVVTLDASNDVHAQFQGVDDVRGVWLLAEICLSPKLVSKFYPDVSFFYSMHNPFIHYLFEKKCFEETYIESGGSVANSALDIARKFGCNPIIFVAQDLCLEGARSHAAGTMHEDERYVPEGVNYVTLPGNYEKEVKSFRNFFTFLRWTENFISKNPGIEFINATAGGAKIEGTKLATLDELAKRFSSRPDIDTQAAITRVKKGIASGCGKAAINKIKRALKQLQGLDKLLLKGVGLTTDVSAIINGKMKIEESKEKKLSLRVHSFFLKLANAQGMSLLDCQVKNELTSMLRSAETNRIRVKGYSDAMLLMPDIFKKLLSSSKAVQQGFKNVLKMGRF